MFKGKLGKKIDVPWLSPSGWSVQPLGLYVDYSLFIEVKGSGEVITRGELDFNVSEFILFKVSF